MSDHHGLCCTTCGKHTRLGDRFNHGGYRLLELFNSDVRDKLADAAILLDRLTNGGRGFYPDDLEALLEAGRFFAEHSGPSACEVKIAHEWGKPMAAEDL